MKLSLRMAALAAALLLFAPVGPARADEATDEFKAHVQRAKVHYDLGEFDDAAEEYIQAYRIKPVAGALFNIAQAYRQGGRYDKSRQFYRSFLREANPDAKAKAQVEKQIRELDELIAKEEKTKQSKPTGVEATLTPPPGKDELAPPPVAVRPTKAKPVDELAPPVAATLAPAPAPAPTPTAATPPAATPPIPAPAAPANKVAVVDTRPKPSAAPAPTATPAPPAATRADASADAAPSGGRSHVLAYVAGGAALVLLGGGTFFGVQAARADNELTAGPHARADADTLISTSKSDHTLSAVLLVGGAAAAVGAGLLYFLPTSGPSGGTGAAVGGHF